jgi:hypothetical protein
MRRAVVAWLGLSLPASIASVVLGGAGCGRARGEAPHNTPAAAPAGTAAGASAGLPAGASAGASPDEPAARAFAASRAGLGAYRARGKHTLTVVDRQSGAVVESLAEDSLVERGADGALHARYQNSRDQARELIAAGGELYLRPGFGAYHQRAPVDAGEVERARAEIDGALAADVELCAPRLVASDGGQVTRLGRAAHRLVLALGAPAPRAAPARAARAWREAAEIAALAGEIVVDDVTGAVLAATLEARVSYKKGERTLELRLAGDEAVADLGAVNVTAPADAVASPGRSTEIEDRDELLSGLAPPPRRGK